MRIRIAQEKDKNNWDSIVSQNDAWTSFRLEWQQPMKLIGWNCENLMIYNDSDLLIGVFPFYFKEKNFIFMKLRYYASSANSFGGILLKKRFEPYEGFFKDFQKELKKFVKKRKGVFYKINTHPIINNSKFNGEIYNKYTFLLRLDKSEEELITNMKKKSRTAIRKAEKSNVKVKKIESIKELKEFHQLHRKTYERSGAKVRPFVYFKSFYNNLVIKGLCRFYMAYLEDKAIAGIMVLGNNKVMIYGAGASDINYSTHNPNNLLLWHAIKDAKKEGFKYFDFSSVAHPKRTHKEEGIFKFKESFGGELTEKKVIKVFCYMNFLKVFTKRMIK